MTFQPLSLSPVHAFNSGCPTSLSGASLPGHAYTILGTCNLESPVLPNASKPIPMLPLPIGKPMRFLTSIPVSFEEAARMHPYATLRRPSRRSTGISGSVKKTATIVPRTVTLSQPLWMEKEPSPAAMQPAHMGNEFGRPGRSGYTTYPSPIPSLLNDPLSASPPPISKVSLPVVESEPSQAFLNTVESEPSRESRRVKRYVCTVCSKPFSRPSTLQTHMNGHTGAKPFECALDGCTARFSVLSNRNRHQKMCALKR